MGRRSVPGVVLVVSCVVAACSSGSSSTSPTGIPGPATVTAPSPLPSPAPAPAVDRWTLFGTVRDAFDNAPLSTVTIKVADGPDANRMATTDGAGNFTLRELASSGFTLEVSRVGYESSTRPVTLVRNAALDISLTRQCSRPPAPALTATISESSVVFWWPNASGATGYVLEAGTSPGAVNALSATLSGNWHLWTNVSPGTYYARVRATNACGASGTSAEAVVSLNAWSPAPPASAP
jgi:hypothetical protein